MQAPLESSLGFRAGRALAGEKEHCCLLDETGILGMLLGLSERWAGPVYGYISENPPGGQGPPGCLKGMWWSWLQSQAWVVPTV